MIGKGCDIRLLGAVNLVGQKTGLLRSRGFIIARRRIYVDSGESLDIPRPIEYKVRRGDGISCNVKTS